ISTEAQREVRAPRTQSSVHQATNSFWSPAPSTGTAVEVEAGAARIRKEASMVLTVAAVGKAVSVKFPRRTLRHPALTARPACSIRLRFRISAALEGGADKTVTQVAHTCTDLRAPTAR